VAAAAPNTTFLNMLGYESFPCIFSGNVAVWPSLTWWAKNSCFIQHCNTSFHMIAMNSSVNPNTTLTCSSWKRVLRSAICAYLLWHG
jgi:hypothetical protein